MQFFILNDQKGIVLHTGDYQSWKESVEATPLVGSTQVGGKAFITKFTGVAGYDTKGCFETLVIMDGCSEVLQKYDTWLEAEEGHVRQVAVAWGGVTKVPEDKIKIVPNYDPKVQKKFKKAMKDVFGAPTYYNPKSNDGSQEMSYPSSSSSETSESSSSKDVIDEVKATKNIKKIGIQLCKKSVEECEKKLAELKKQKVMSQTKLYKPAPLQIKKDSNPDIPLLKKMIKYAKKKFEVALEDLNQTEKYANLEPGLEQEVKKKSALRNKLWHELEDLQVKLTNALKKDDVYLDKDDVDYDPEHDGFGEELKSTTPRLKTEGLAQPATK